MRTNPFYDSLLFILGQSNDHVGSGVQYPVAALYMAALIASIYFAWRNWQEDMAQRTLEHVSTWAMRVLIGSMWFEGSLWKLPLPRAGGFQYWLEQEIPNAAFAWHGWIIKNILAPNIVLLNTPVYLTELAMALALILGFMVRPLAVVGMLFTLQLWLGLYKLGAEWPWSYIFLVFVHAFFFINKAGMSLGLDALLARHRFGQSTNAGLAARIYAKVA